MPLEGPHGTLPIPHDPRWADLRFYFNAKHPDADTDPYRYNDHVYDAVCDWEPLLTEGPTFESGGLAVKPQTPANS